MSWTNKGSIKGPKGLDTSRPGDLLSATFGTGELSLSGYTAVTFDTVQNNDPGLNITSTNNRAYIATGGVFYIRAGYRFNGNTAATGMTASVRWFLSGGYIFHYRTRSQIPLNSQGEIASEFIVTANPGDNIGPEIWSSASNAGIILDNCYFTVQRLASWSGSSAPPPSPGPR